MLENLVGKALRGMPGAQQPGSGPLLQMIDRLTPNGTLPQSGIADALCALARIYRAEPIDRTRAAARRPL